MSAHGMQATESAARVTASVAERTANAAQAQRNTSAAPESASGFRAPTWAADPLAGATLQAFKNGVLVQTTPLQQKATLFGRWDTAAYCALPCVSQSTCVVCLPGVISLAVSATPSMTTAMPSPPSQASKRRRAAGARQHQQAARGAVLPRRRSGSAHGPSLGAWHLRRLRAPGQSGRSARLHAKMFGQSPMQHAGSLT